MAMSYSVLYNTIQSYAENREQLFVSNIPIFIQEAESRIYNSVNLPSLRKNVTGVISANNPYVSLPEDWLANYSLAVIDSSGRYNYLLNKDVNFLREAYPNPNATGEPAYYALFGSQLGNFNEMTYIVAPTPDKDYEVEMHYFYYPPTIVQGQISSFSGFVGGSLYTPGTYQGVPLTGGTGFNATADIVVTNGSVTSCNLDFGGNFYVTGDILSCESLGRTGSGFAVTVGSISNATGRSWLGDNYDPVLFYGAMREAMIFMKAEADMVTGYEQKYQEALAQLQRLSDGLERGDFYRNGQTKINVRGVRP